MPASARPSYAELLAKVQAPGARLDVLVRQNLFEGTPLIFDRTPSHYELLREHLGTSLGVAQSGITIVGSRRLGFSLNPSHPGDLARENSDVDVIVADAALFDEVWSMLVRWRYPWHTRDWTEPARTWAVREVMESLLMGQCNPFALRAPPPGKHAPLRRLRKFVHNWFEAFKTANVHRPLAGYEFKGRLYRTWDFATLYHVEGLRLIARRNGPVTTSLP